MRITGKNQDAEDQHWAGQLQQVLHTEIPLTCAMQLEVSQFDQAGLVLRAPLDPNRNDKGTGFGGSINSILTLAAWGMVWIHCARNSMDVDIVIHKGEIAYLQPVAQALVARCESPGIDAWTQFDRHLQRRGRARIAFSPTLVLRDGSVAAEYNCRYAALKRKEPE